MQNYEIRRNWSVKLWKGKCYMVMSDMRVYVHETLSNYGSNVNDTMRLGSHVGDPESYVIVSDT